MRDQLSLQQVEPERKGSWELGTGVYGINIVDKKIPYSKVSGPGLWSPNF